LKILSFNSRSDTARLEGKRKMSQNRPPADRAGVIAGLSAEGRDDVAALVPAPG
jgi:transcriptional regulator